MKISPKTISAIQIPNKGLTLLEVLITVAILAGAIVFVFRGFLTALSATKFSQNVTLACLLAEDKIWKAENNFPDTDEGSPEAKKES
ncbi:MAG: prepilin-type N-terminal cleavage/methylation domain-containing protein, partial [Candidatus Omnitrophota bacterium]